MKPQFSFSHRRNPYWPWNKKERSKKAKNERKTKALKGLYLGLKPLVLSSALFAVVIAALSY